MHKEKFHVVVYNNVEYIVYLEYGHSRQAPTGMVRITAQEIAQMLKIGV